MKYLKQDFDLSDDSFSYTILGEKDPIYRVDSFAYLFEKGVQIGKFHLRDTHWDLVLDSGNIFHGHNFGLNKLPEFELFVLTKLVNLNQERPSAL